MTEVNLLDIKKQKQAPKLNSAFSPSQDLTAMLHVWWSCRIRVKCKASSEEPRNV